MSNERELPKRKWPRLKNFDYSSVGAYFVTICIRDKKRLLSEIAWTRSVSFGSAIDKELGLEVGTGLAPSVNVASGTSVGTGLAPSVNVASGTSVGTGLAPSEGLFVGDGAIPLPKITVRLKPCGEVVKEQLRLIEVRFPNVTVADYVIMPDHIHAIIFFRKKTGGASPAPTLGDVICAFKSLTSRICKQRFGIEKMFQRSFIEHIVRDQDDYETRRKYVYENPMRWYYKRLDLEDEKQL